jgi:hypothetical protein
VLFSLRHCSRNPGLIDFHLVEYRFPVVEQERDDDRIFGGGASVTL